MVKKLNPEEPIPHLNGIVVADFWSWAYSDILSNRNRAVFAEFLVGAALDVLEEPRIEWEGYDLLYCGKKIEVKASAFLQSWSQNRLSKISFDISLKNAWDSKTNRFANTIQRHADCYVFCLYLEIDPAKVNVLNIDRWEFYIVPTSKIDAICGPQKSIALNRLRQFCRPVTFEHIKPTVNNLLFAEDNSLS